MMPSSRFFFFVALFFFFSSFGCGKGEETESLPTISSITSEKGKAEGPVSGGTPITFRGSHFSGDAVVFFGDIPSPAVTVENQTTLIAESPAVFKSKTVSVSMTTGGQFVEKQNAFRYTPIIAFSSNRSLTGSPGSFDIFTMEVDSGGKEQITNNALGVQPPSGPTEINGSPSFSPDGREILFETNRTGDFEIFTMTREGFKQTNLTNHPENDRSPSFSPDGRQIVFVSNRKQVPQNPEGDFELFIMDRNGENQKQITFNATNDFSPAFSPDESQIVFVSNREILLINPAGGPPTALTSDGFDNRDPSFSPDGSQILFVSDRVKDPNQSDGNFEIFVMDRNGNNLTQLTENQSDVSASAFLTSLSPSPEILFSTNKTLNPDRTKNKEIFKMSCIGAGLTFITTCDEENASNLSLNTHVDIAPASSP